MGMDTRTKTVAAALVALALAACNAVGMGARVTRSKFDGTRAVQIDPHGLGGGSFGGLGAVWNSGQPETTTLVVAVFRIASISAAELNVDGQVVQLGEKAVPTSFETATVGRQSFTHSTREFTVPTEVVKRILSSERTMVRIWTSIGPVEGRIVDGDDDSKALHALRRFMAAVEAQ